MESTYVGKMTSMEAISGECARRVETALLLRCKLSRQMQLHLRNQPKRYANPAVHATAKINSRHSAPAASMPPVNHKNNRFPAREGKYAQARKQTSIAHSERERRSRSALLPPTFRQRTSETLGNSWGPPQPASRGQRRLRAGQN